MRGLAAGGSILLSLLVGRMFGAGGLGMFAVFVTLLGALGILSNQGLTPVLVRTIALEHAEGVRAARMMWAAMKSLGGVPLLAGAGGAALLVSGLLGRASLSSAAAFFMALPLLTALSLMSGYLRGQGRTWAAPFFELSGISLIAALVLSVVWWAGWSLEQDMAPWFLLCAMLLAALVAGGILWRDMQGAPLSAVMKGRKARLEPGSGHFLMIALAGFLVQAGSFLLAAPFLADKTLGIMRAVERLALLVSFAIPTIETVIAPDVVRHAKRRERAALRRLILWAIGVAGAIGAVPFLLLMLFPAKFLGLAGPEFVPAAGYLRVMAFTHLLLLLLGPFITLMNMGGKERTAMWINLAALAAAVILFPALSFLFGASGFIAAYVIVTAGRALVIFGQSGFINRSW